jgi:hypothetical protein
MWHKNFLFIGLLAVSLGFVGCTKNQTANTPEAALDQYVSAAFSAKNLDDKSKLLNMATGDALAHLQKMKDDEFKKQFLDANLKLVSLKVKDIREDNEGGVSMVYELSFQDGKSGAAVVHTNKKVAYLTKIDGGQWKIRATQNVKSYIEKKEDLVITPETTH